MQGTRLVGRRPSRRRATNSSGEAAVRRGWATNQRPSRARGQPTPARDTHGVAQRESEPTAQGVRHLQEHESRRDGAAGGESRTRVRSGRIRERRTPRAQGQPTPCARHARRGTEGVGASAGLCMLLHRTRRTEAGVRAARREPSQNVPRAQFHAGRPAMVGSASP